MCADLFQWKLHRKLYCNYRQPMKLREGNVFSGVCRQGVPCDYYPWCIGPHHTGTPPHHTGIPWPKPCTLLVTSGDQDWRPVQTCLHTEPPHPLAVTSGGQDQRLVQTCSLEDPINADIWWFLWHVRWAVRILLECFLVLEIDQINMYILPWGQRLLSIPQLVWR